MTTNRNEYFRNYYKEIGNVYQKKYYNENKDHILKKQKIRIKKNMNLILEEQFVIVALNISQKIVEGI